ncbi:MAG: DinB family protein [Phycisphaerae bacterium]|jgi:hypothetical protein|nr:DinB family protein [Phycisphaerae bacterium]HOO17119.1 DinB family protein [Phycisphaerae bacterium]HPC23388.1 DinB family protein [Phycisphaerae bacterium]HRS27740.1 DinB family protein [Phycisphaerae bacterium]HRT42679.1 DinB family protein [Phycisphaerae bacterium]
MIQHTHAQTAQTADVLHGVRQHVLWLLDGGNAHLDFDAAVAGLPAKLRGAKPINVPYSPWRLIEHMRLSQWDILEFCRNPKHVSPEWPEGYWPQSDAPPDERAWEASLREFHDDLAAMRALIKNPQANLLAPLPHGEGQTLLREALLLADHNAYHLGQLVTVRRALGAWPEE